MSALGRYESALHAELHLSHAQIASEVASAGLDPALECKLVRAMILHALGSKAALMRSSDLLLLCEQALQAAKMPANSHKQ